MPFTAVFTLYVVWIGLTVAFPLSNRVRAFLTRHDHFAVVPLWMFFAPNPVRVDIHLAIRDRTADGLLTPFREVEFCEVVRPWWTAIWYPRRRYHKYLNEAIKVLLASSRTVATDELVLTFPYLAIANIVARFPGVEGCCDRQFAIVSTSGPEGEDEQALVFASDFHTIPAP